METLQDVASILAGMAASRTGCCGMMFGMYHLATGCTKPSGKLSGPLLHVDSLALDHLFYHSPVHKADANVPETCLTSPIYPGSLSGGVVQEKIFKFVLIFFGPRKTL